jgi:hypothetical protein
MALDYSVEPSLMQRWKPALQNWRLFAFIGFFFLLFGCFGYTILSEVLTHGIHQHGTYTTVELKPLGQFPFSEQSGLLTDVPREYRALDGKRVELKGMMYPSQHSAAADVAEFQLVYNIQKCCFSGPPQVQERVFVHLSRDNPVRFYDQLVSCVGKLHVRLKRNDQGTVYSVYDLDLESLTPTSD